MEKILCIIEASFPSKEDDYNQYDGFIIKTDEQEIKIGISNYQNCCESWGYLISEDNLDSFIGAILFDIKIVDQALKVEQAPEENEYEGAVMFVNFETDKGTLQFTAYNCHNGYYSHEAVLVSRQKTHSEYL